MSGRGTTPLVATALLVGVGGVVGATLRYAVGLVVPGLAGTLAVNAAGSLALGALVAESRHAGHFADRTHLLAGTGLLSSFTTYSTFVVESAGAAPALLVGNVVATYVLGFAGALAGGRAVRRLVGAGGPVPGAER
jgi:CrcB protein